MPNEVINYNSLTCGVGLDEAQQTVVLIFETKESVTVQIGLSGKGMLGVIGVLQKLAKSHPHILDWQSLPRH